MDGREGNNYCLDWRREGRNAEKNFGASAKRGSKAKRERVERNNLMGKKPKKESKSPPCQKESVNLGRGQ